MNKELEQQADHIAAIREALEDARIVVGNTHLINVALSSLESLEAHSKPIQGEVAMTAQVGDLNAVASLGAQYPKFANGGSETVYTVMVDHPCGRWDQIWVLRDQALAARVANALNAAPSTVPLSPEMVEKIMEVVDDVCSFDNWSVPQIQRLRTRLLGIR